MKQVAKDRESAKRSVQNVIGIGCSVTRIFGIACSGKYVYNNLFGRFKKNIAGGIKTRGII